VVHFLELSTPGRAELALEEMRLAERCALVGRTIADLEREWGRLRVVAIERDGRAIQVVPESSATLAEGDLLIVIGERETLVRLAQAASGDGG
jgi:Trk K+ transport system NAD-binding subunit